MPYEYLEEIGIADIAFEATGRDLAELFSDAADATTNVMIDNIEAIQPRETRQIELSNDKLDMLLFDLLQELIFLKDAERLLLRMRQLEIEEKDKKLFLHGIAEGESLDPELLFGIERERKIAPLEHRHQPEFESFAFTSSKIFSRDCFEGFVNGLPASVVRAKGFIRFADGTQLFNFVAGRWELEPFEFDRTELVFIGRKIGAEREVIFRALNGMQQSK